MVDLNLDGLDDIVDGVTQNLNLNDAIDGVEEKEERPEVVVEPPKAPEVTNYNPVTSGTVIKKGGVPPKEQPRWGEKFGAARKAMWVDVLYENSDYANDFAVEDGWKIDDEELKSLSFKFDEIWFDNITESRSQNEFEFRKARAEEALKNHERMGDRGFGTVTAMLAAGLTDPAYMPLYFVPYGRLAAGAQQFQGATRIAKYMKMGSIVGATEGTAIGGIDYMLRPDAQLYEVLFGTALGGVLGGGIGAVQARLMRDIDAEHFINHQIKLTKKGMREFENHTPQMKQKRTRDALLPEDADAPKPAKGSQQKLPTVEGRVEKVSAGSYRYTEGDEVYLSLIHI